MKKCFKCGQEKEITEFYKHQQMADGHLGKCKECTKRDVHENYDLNFEKYREYEQERSQKKERKEKNIEYQRSRRHRHRDKAIAYNAVWHALTSGKLKRQQCEVCGAHDSQAHHDDYSKPLEVRWLCFVHHRLLHGQRNVTRRQEKQREAA